MRATETRIDELVRRRNETDFKRQEGMSWTSKLRWSVIGRRSLERLVESCEKWCERMGMHMQTAWWGLQTWDLRNITDVENSNDTDVRTAGFLDGIPVRKLLLIEPGEMLDSTSPEALATATAGELEIQQAAGISLNATVKLQIPMRDVIMEGKRPTFLDFEICRLVPTRAALMGILPDDILIIEPRKYLRNHLSADFRRMRAIHLALLLRTATEANSQLPFLPVVAFFDNTIDNIIGIIYRFPTVVLSMSGGYSRIRPPLSTGTNLDKLLNSGLIKGLRRPSLYARLQLALSLSSAIHCLHQYNWLHKFLIPHFVTFFPLVGVNERTGSIELPEPYLTNFTQARADNNRAISTKQTAFMGGDVTENRKVHLHMHPDRWRCKEGPAPVRFSKQHDIYSLGVMLLEIGMWEPVQKMGTISSALKNNSLIQIRPAVIAMLISLAQQELPFFMGERYVEVVVGCLRGRVLVKKAMAFAEFEDEDNQCANHLEASIVEEFSEAVVGILEELLNGVKGSAQTH